MHSGSGSQARDPERLAALYTEDACFYGSTTELYRGRDGVLRYFCKLPLKYKRAQFGEPALAVLGPDTVVAAGPVAFEIESDGAIKTMPYRITQVVIRRSERWLIAAHRGTCQQL